MKKLLTVVFVLALCSFVTNSAAFAQKVGSNLSFFPTKYSLNSNYSVCPVNGKFRLVVCSVKNKVLYNLWSYHSTFADAEYLRNRLIEAYKPGGAITCIEAKVRSVMPVKPGPHAQYTKILTLLITKVYVKPKI